MLYDDTVILLFAKAPIEGSVNTRLIADIGVQAATLLQHDLIHQRLSMLTAAGLCTVRLLCSPDVSHPCFVQCQQQYGVELYEQRGDDLGERIADGIKSALTGFACCIVIGTDAPALDENMIRQAVDCLHAGSEIVFVPAEDGGYVLVGLRHACEFLFHDISWGSAQVMQQSRHALETRNIAYTELASSWDVDRLEDYRRYLRLQQESTS